MIKYGQVKEKLNDYSIVGASQFLIEGPSTKDGSIFVDKLTASFENTIPR